MASIAERENIHMANYKDETFGFPNRRSSTSACNTAAKTTLRRPCALGVRGPVQLSTRLDGLGLPRVENLAASAAPPWNAHSGANPLRCKECDAWGAAIAWGSSSSPCGRTAQIPQWAIASHGDTKTGEDPCWRLNAYCPSEFITLKPPTHHDATQRWGLWGGGWSWGWSIHYWDLCPCKSSLSPLPREDTASSFAQSSKAGSHSAMSKKRDAHLVTSETSFNSKNYF